MSVLDRPSPRIVLVTGGARGVGRAVCRRFAQHGDHVIINYFHSPEAAEEIRRELSDAGGSVELQRASVAHRGQVSSMFDAVRERYGRLDVLVNNAAAGALLPLDEVDDALWQRAFDTNVRGALWCSQHAAPLMSDGGAIVNLSSLGSSLVIGHYACVGATKAALEALTRYLAVEYAPRRIRVNTASGGLIDGEIAGRFPDAAGLRGVVEASTPWRRLGREDELAALVFFLASRDAAWITGQVVIADGGLSLGATLLSPPSMPHAAPRQDTAARQDTASLRSRPELSEDDRARRKGDNREGDSREDEEHEAAIAVVGMGLVAPGVNDPEEFWLALHREQHFFSEPSRFPIDHFYSAAAAAEDKAYCRTSGYVTAFQPHPRLAAELLRGDIAAAHERTALWLRHCLHQALADVSIDGARAFLAVGYCVEGSHELEEALVHAAFARRLSAASADVAGVADAVARLRRRYRASPLAAAEFLPHRILRHAAAGLLPERTEMLTVDTACSSSLYAIDLGMKALRDDECDVAVCGGAFAYSARSLVLFSKVTGLSRSGELRALDRQASGVVFADGAGLLMLKRLDRARRDGNRILAVIERSGLSCDGGGKAIYAPSERGQRLALARTYPSDTAAVDWIVAHATGTRAGDECEITALDQAMTGTPPVFLTSNKALIGHTAWAAGAVSAVHAVLGLQHRAVPPQPYVSEPHPALAGTRFRVPLEPTPLPVPADRPLRVGVSAFGFGGTNAHLVLSTDDGTTPARRSPATSVATDEIVMVGWAVDLPGAPTPDRVQAWLTGAAPEPPASFGDEYPRPDPREVRLSGALLRMIDRSQTMLIRAYGHLSREVQQACAGSRDTVGIIVGHMGPTRRAVEYAMRCYLDDVAAVVTDAPAVVHAMQRVRQEIQASVPASTEDAFPGMLPNIIASRLASFADFRGLNVTIDTGPDASLDAVRSAERYLRHGDLDVAVVGAVNGNTMPELSSVLTGTDPAAAQAATKAVELAEGAFILVLTRASVAKTHALPILARVRTGHRAVRDEVDPPDRESRRIGDGVPSAHTRRSYLGADGLVALLALIATGTRARLRSAEEWGPFVDVDPVSASVESSTKTEARPDMLPVMRTRVEWQPAPARPARVPDFALPEHTLIVSHAGVLDERSLGARVSVVHPLSIDASEAELRDAIARIAHPWRHLRVVVDLGAEDWPAWLLPLHDLLFVATKAWAGQPAANPLANPPVNASATEGRSPMSRLSFRVLVLRGIRDGVPRPASGLFTGFVKAVSRERPDLTCHCVLTDHADVDLGWQMLAAESGLSHVLPAAGYCGGQRWAATFHVEAERLSTKAPPDSSASPEPASMLLPRDAVILAIGGARGLTAECLLALDRARSPILYLIGRSPLPDVDPTRLPTQIDYLRAHAARDAAVDRSALIAAYQRLRAGAEARRNVTRLAARYGADRVAYLACDITIREQVRQTIDAIFARHGRIDLLINAAGLHRPGDVPTTSLKDFRIVRDTKARGYRHLRDALAGRPPARWMNVGSLLATIGWPGESAYCAGNDYLASSAQWQTRHERAREITIAWPLWTEAGFAAEPLTRDLVQRQGRLTGLSIASGRTIFRAEIDRAAVDAEVAYLGSSERALLDVHVDRLSARGFFLDARSSTWTPEIAGRDGYLRHHLLDGRPVLPGAFALALVAEAISDVTRGRRVLLRNIAFHLPISPAVRDLRQVYGVELSTGERSTGERDVEHASGVPTMPIDFQIVRRLPPSTGRPADVVRVCATGQLIVQGEDGAGQTRGVRLPTVSRSLRGPFFAGSSRLRLDGLFASLADVRAEHGQVHARFAPDLGLWASALAQFVLPGLLIDAMIQASAIGMMSAADVVEEPIVAGVSRVECVCRDNDYVLLERYGTEIRIGTESREAGGPGDAAGVVAVAPDGRVLARLSGLLTSGIRIGIAARTPEHPMRA